MEIYNRIPMSTRIAFIDLCLRTISQLTDISGKVNNITELMNMQSEYLYHFDDGTNLIILFKSYISYLDEIIVFNHDHYFLESLKKTIIPSIQSEMEGELEVFKTLGTDYLSVKTHMAKIFKRINSEFIRKMPAISVSVDEDLSIPETTIKLLATFCSEEIREFEYSLEGIRQIIGKKLEE